MADERDRFLAWGGKRPTKYMSPPGLRTTGTRPPRPAPAPTVADAAAEREKPVTWWRMAALAFGGVTAAPAVLAPTPASAVVKFVEPVTDPMDLDLSASLARSVAPEVGFDAVGEVLREARTVRLQFTVAIDGVPEEKAAEIAAEVHETVEAAAARLLGEADGGSLLPVDGAPDSDESGWRLAYRFVAPAVKVARLLGEILAEFAKAGLGVIAGVELTRWLLRAVARRSGSESGIDDDEDAADAEVEVAVGLKTAAAPDPKAGGAAKGALKQMKDFADGLVAVADLLARAGA